MALSPWRHQFRPCCKFNALTTRPPVEEVAAGSEAAQRVFATRAGMKTVRVTRSQYEALQTLSRRDINTIRKHPAIVTAARDLLRACRKVVKRIKAISDHASRRKRRTAYRKIVALCEAAIARAESR